MASEPKSFIFETRFERREVILEGLVRLIDCLELDLAVVVEQVLAEDKGMVTLFGSLDEIPVLLAIETLVRVVIRKGEVEICRIQLLVNLVVEKFVHL